jgi:RimJ/RimL family protein N-acetyltransferase
MDWPEVLETERLILRPPVEADASQIFERYAQDPEVTRYMPWRPHQRIEDAHEFVRRCRAGWASGKEFTWMLARRGEGDVIGAIALRSDGHKANIGYVLARAFWGQGLMPEAGRALIRHASQLESIHRVWAVCDVDNRASARVMEKIGMEREGILRRWLVHTNLSPLPRDVFCYSWVPDRPNG